MHLFKKLLLVSLPLCCALYADVEPSLPPYPHEDEGKTSPMFSDAQAEAVYWLTLLDQLQFEPSWEEAGPLLKDTVTRTQWREAMNSVRRPLGYASMRKMDNFRVLTVLPYGTKGYFMQITFNTDFYARSSAREVCTLMYDDFQRWRVISYRIL